MRAVIGHRQMTLMYHDAWYQTVSGVVVAAVLALPLLPMAASMLAGSRRRAGYPSAWARRSAVLDVGLAYGTVIPIWLTMLPGGNREISLVPFRDMATMPPYQVVGNMLLLAALGFLAPMRFPVFASWIRTVLLVMAVSCGIETCQYVLPVGRIASVDDVLLNTAGGAFAALASRPWWVARGLPIRSAKRYESGIATGNR